MLGKLEKENNSLTTLTKSIDNINPYDFLPTIPRSNVGTGSTIDLPSQSKLTSSLKASSK